MNSRNLLTVVVVFLLPTLPVVTLFLLGFSVLQAGILLLYLLIAVWVAYYHFLLLKEREQGNEERDQWDEERDRLNDKLSRQAQELKAIQEALEGIPVQESHPSVYGEQLLELRFTEEWDRAKRYQRPFSCLLVEIDALSETLKRNATVSPRAMSQEFGTFLKKNMRSVDIIIRQKENRYLVILPETGLTGARVAGERARYSVEKNLFRINETELRLTASIAVASFDPTIHLEKMDLLKSLDTTLTEARKNGPNRVVTFSHEAS